MTRTFDAVKVTDHIYWVGAVDWSVRDFHGYLTQRGSTYNAYLIVTDNRAVLVDTVKAPFLDEMLERIRSVVPLEKVDTIVSNHAEMDHSGSLPAAIEAIGPDKVYASTMGVKALHKHYGEGLAIEALKEGETMDVGGLTLHFVETRMVHWPDSMFTYVAEEKLLFSQDGFGMHLASNERFADRLDPCVLDYEAAKYYANILLPLSPIIRKLLDKVNEMGVALDVIAPDHGPIWRTPETVGRIVGQYDTWSKNTLAKKAVVVYGTMWQSTAKMAKAIMQGLADEDVPAHLLEVGPNHRSDLATEMLDASALVVGSPTLNNNILPGVADVLTYLKGLKPRDRIGAAFGSYGWSGESTKDLAGILEEMKIESVAEPVKVQYVPTDEELAQCRELGREVGRKVKAKMGG